MITKAASLWTSRQLHSPSIPSELSAGLDCASLASSRPVLCCVVLLTPAVQQDSLTSQCSITLLRPETRDERQYSANTADKSLDSFVSQRVVRRRQVMRGSSAVSATGGKQSGPVGARTRIKEHPGRFFVETFHCQVQPQKKHSTDVGTQLSCDNKM